MFTKVWRLLVPLAICAGFTFGALAQEKKPEAKPEPKQEQKKEEPGALAVGKKAPEFTAKTMAGKEVKFPGVYKDKVIVLNFCLTTDPACKAECGKLLEAYKKFHERGLEILMVWLDKPKEVSAEKVNACAKEYGVDKWDRIYDDAEKVAKVYNVKDAAARFLVDGEKGTILAMGADLKGDMLMKTVEKNLKAKPAPMEEEEEEEEEEGGARAP